MVHGHDRLDHGVPKATLSSCMKPRDSAPLGLSAPPNLFTMAGLLLQDQHCCLRVAVAFAHGTNYISTLVIAGPECPKIALFLL